MTKSRSVASTLPPNVAHVIEEMDSGTHRERLRIIAENAIASGDDPMEAIALDLVHYENARMGFPDNLDQLDAAAVKRRSAQEKHERIRKEAKELFASNKHLTRTSVAEILGRKGLGSQSTILRALRSIGVP